jgi:hypothetical protein
MVSCTPAFWTSGGFLRRFALVDRQGEELLALPAWANFKVSGSFVINVRGQEQLERVISNRAAIGEFDNGQTVIKDFEAPFLPSSRQDMSEDEYRLSLTLRAEVPQSMLGTCRAGKLATGAGSKHWRWHHDTVTWIREKSPVITCVKMASRRIRRPPQLYSNTVARRLGQKSVWRDNRTWP